MLIVPDARGHGRSARGQGETSIKQLASDVLQIMDTLNIEAAGFAGCSLGSSVGMYLGAQAPTRFEWLVLANAPARIPLPKETFEQGIADARAGAFPEMARGMIGNWLANATKAARPELADVLLEQMLQTEGDGFADAFAALRDSDRTGDLGMITAPALVITGEADHAFPPAAAQEMAAGIPGAHAAVIARAGHLAPAEQPERFAELIRDFVRGIPAAGNHR
jgi:3-oxoadipate enol-lactonase